MECRYKLVSRISEGLTELRTRLEEHITAQGLSAIERGGEAAHTDPKVYVTTILDVHKKYNALVMSAFSNDAGFVASLDKACGKFINGNAVTRQANSSSKSPELLAKYCDLLLKKSAKNPEEAELEDTLYQVVSLRNRFFLFHLNETPVVFFYYGLGTDLHLPHFHLDPHTRLYEVF